MQMTIVQLLVEQLLKIQISGKIIFVGDFCTGNIRAINNSKDSKLSVLSRDIFFTQ